MPAHARGSVEEVEDTQARLTPFLREGVGDREELLNPASSETTQSLLPLDDNKATAELADETGERFDSHGRECSERNTSEEYLAILGQSLQGGEGGSTREGSPDRVQELFDRSFLIPSDDEKPWKVDGLNHRAERVVLRDRIEGPSDERTVRVSSPFRQGVGERDRTHSLLKGDFPGGDKGIIPVEGEDPFSRPLGKDADRDHKRTVHFDLLREVQGGKRGIGRCRSPNWESGNGDAGPLRRSQRRVETVGDPPIAHQDKLVRPSFGKAGKGERYCMVEIGLLTERDCFKQNRPKRNRCRKPGKLFADRVRDHGSIGERNRAEPTPWVSSDDRGHLIAHLLGGRGRGDARGAIDEEGDRLKGVLLSDLRAGERHQDREYSEKAEGIPHAKPAGDYNSHKKDGSCDKKNGVREMDHRSSLLNLHPR